MRVLEGTENGTAATAGADVFTFQSVKRKNKMAQMGEYLRQRQRESSVCIHAQHICRHKHAAAYGTLLRVGTEVLNLDTVG